MRNGFIAAGVLVLCLVSRFTQGDDLPTVLSGETIAVIQWTGQQSWPAYEETISYRAFFGSGLVPALTRPFLNLNWPNVAAITGSTPEDIDLFRKIAEHIWTHGFTAAGGMNKQLIPYGFVIVPQAGEWALPIFTRATNSDTETDIAGRKVFRMADDSAGIETVLWSEAGDLVLYAGPIVQDAPEELEWKGLATVLEAADGGSQLAGSDEWTNSWSTPLSENDTLRVWLNFGAIAEIYGPAALATTDDNSVVTLSQILTSLGLDKWKTISFRSGSEGKHVVSEWILRSSSPPAEWLGWQEKRIGLNDLPPLPKDMTSFSVQVVDIPKAYDTAVRLGETMRSNQDFIVGVLNSLGISAGVNAEESSSPDLTALAKTLGHVVCIYHDRQQQVLPWGLPTIAISVKDREALIKELDALAARGADAADHMRRDDRWGCPLYLGTSGLRIGGDATASNTGKPTLAVCGDWLVIAVQPQTVQTFILRSEGKLPKWDQNQIPEITRSKIPQEFTRLTFSDPRPAVGFLMRLAPWLSDLVGIGIAMDPGSFLLPEAREGFSPLDIPAAEVVTADLFPNVSVTECGPDGIRQKMYASTTLDNMVFWGAASYVSLGIFESVGVVVDQFL